MTIISSGYFIFNDIELILNDIIFKRIRTVVILKETQNENTICSAELCMWKTINPSAIQECKKKGFNSRERVDRVKITANMFLFSTATHLLIVGTLDFNL